MHKDWRDTEEMPYYFSRSSVKFEGHRGQIIANFDPVFPDSNSSLKSQMAFKLHTHLIVAWKKCPIVFKVSHQILKSHMTKKITNFKLNWSFSDGNSSLNSPMAMGWCTKLEVVLKSCPILFQDHPSNLKVTQGKQKLAIMTRKSKKKIIILEVVRRKLP